jgi:ketosteroid isomerase-like protein
MSVELVTSFYEAFSRRDAKAMVAAYADDVRFSDPVFPDLRGERARNMWRMLCERGKDLEVAYRDVTVEGTSGSAHWEAHYTFTVTGKRVHNIIDSRFVFANGRIAAHTDTFDLVRWAGMALGVKGRLLGWTPFVQHAIRKNAARGLDTWIAKNAA